MKELLKKKLGFLYNIYKKSTLHTKKAQIQKELDKKTREKLMNENRLILKKYFDNQLIVHNGPFKGMKYISESSGSSFIPKIIGSYEEPIQKWIQEILVTQKYTKILDIGCAEGYYAVGFALNLPNCKVIAYDIDEVARNNTSKLASLNSVTNIVVKTECNFEEFELEIEDKTLIFCDIEGFEKYLLNPKLCPSLEKADLIIESHDCFVPNITNELIQRFYNTHIIDLVVDYPFRHLKYNLPKKIEDTLFDNLSDEQRPEAMKFIYMRRY